MWYVKIWIDFVVLMLGGLFKMQTKSANVEFIFVKLISRKIMILKIKICLPGGGGARWPLDDLCLL